MLDKLYLVREDSNEGLRDVSFQLKTMSMGDGVWSGSDFAPSSAVVANAVWNLSPSIPSWKGRYLEESGHAGIPMTKHSSR